MRRNASARAPREGILSLYWNPMFARLGAHMLLARNPYGARLSPLSPLEMDARRRIAQEPGIKDTMASTRVFISSKSYFYLGSLFGGRTIHSYLSANLLRIAVRFGPCTAACDSYRSSGS
jgi:hypothetical protein